MKNWTVDEKIIKKYPEQYRRWQLEQLINFGLDGQKIPKKELLKYLSKLDIDPLKKKYLYFLLK